MGVPHEEWLRTFGGRLGMVYVETGDGHAVVELTVRPEHCNPPGVCHGGAIFTLADDAMGAAIDPLCPPGRVPTSSQVSINYARSSRPGDLLRAEVKVLSHGRTAAVLEARVLDIEGRLVALVSAGYLFVPAQRPA
jgi:acyl-CoA thioesterase